MSTDAPIEIGIEYVTKLQEAMQLVRELQEK